MLPRENTEFSRLKLSRRKKIFYKEKMPPNRLLKLSRQLNVPVFFSFFYTGMRIFKFGV
jgi:hypothetical protein